jgi:hypothetical protein
MLGGLVHWLEEHMMPCMYMQHFGIECPGCGIQRAFIELLKGNIIESIRLYPALLPLIFTFGFTIAHLIFKYRNGGTYIKWLFIFSAVLIVVNYTFKLITIHGYTQP